MAETAKRLDEKFDWSDERIVQTIKAIGRVAHVIKTKPHLKLVADDPDNRILECALAIDADFIVTGDKRLPSLARSGKACILKTYDFLKAVKRVVLSFNSRHVIRYRLD